MAFRLQSFPPRFSLSRRESVDALRKKIDRVDSRIVALLNERASLALEIGRQKNRTGRPVYVASRERAVYRQVSEANAGPLPAASVRAVYREVLSACRGIEARMQVAFFGPEATFTHMAAQRHFGSAVRYSSEPTIGDVFREVGARNVDYGVVPVENSTEGVVTHTLDLLQESNVQICGEVSVDIELCLLSRSGRAKDVRRILSHSHALGQCRRWLAAHCAGAAVEEVSSTAQAAREARSDREVAAVSSRLAGEVYGLRIVQANIADNHDNITRFFVIGDDPPSPTGEDKTSIVFAAKDRVGVLHDLLAPFAKHGIDLTKIESRPSRQKAWEYVFFIDFRGHQEEPQVKSALEQLSGNCMFLKVLGSYPRSL